MDGGSKIANTLIITDTVASIPPELAQENNIRIIPCANIVVGDKSYPDGKTLTVAEAYKLIKKDPDSFSTSAIMPGQVLEEYRDCIQPGQDVVHITLSSALTAAYQSANAAAQSLREEYPDTNIRVIDSKTVGGAQGLITLAAARGAANGMNPDQLVDLINRIRPVTGGIMLLDTLRYIYRTGRMSKMSARIASMFNVRPINKVLEDGTLEMADRVRKRSDGFKKLIELIAKDAETKSLHFLVSHASAPDIAQEFCDLLKNEFDCLSMTISDYSPAMGYAVGPGALFIGYQPEVEI